MRAPAVPSTRVFLIRIVILPSNERLISGTQEHALNHVRSIESAAKSTSGGSRPTAMDLATCEANCVRGAIREDLFSKSTSAKVDKIATQSSAVESELLLGITPAETMTTPSSAFDIGACMCVATPPDPWHSLALAPEMPCMVNRPTMATNNVATRNDRFRIRPVSLSDRSAAAHQVGILSELTAAVRNDRGNLREIRHG